MGNLATHYFIKAKDNYPYNLEEVIESLNYALSYDNNYAAAHCLMGQMLAEQVSNFEGAFEHFEKALVSNINFVETYYHYSKALTLFGETEKVKKLLKFAKTVKGINIACIFQRESLLFEKLGDYQKAKELIKEAVQQSFDNEEQSLLKDDLNRIKNKLPKKKKKKKNRKRKKSAQ